MILFYTGSSTKDGEQPNPKQSLGGYISSSRVPNSKINSLFDTVIEQQLPTLEPQIRMIALQNTSGSTRAGVSIWTEKAEDSLFIYKLAAISPAYDPSCDKYYFEDLVSDTELPFQSELDVYDTEGTALIVGDMNELEYIGIWVQRVINPTAIEDLIQNPSNNQDITDAMVEYLRTRTDVNESLSLKIKYT